MIYLLRTTCNWFDFDFNVIGTKGQQNLSNAISWIWICSYYRLYINPTLIFVLFCTNVLVFTTTAWIPCLNAVVSFVLYILLLLFHWCRLNFSVCLFFSCPVKIFIYSWFRRTSTDISKISNPTVSCYCWTYFWRRRNTLCWNEASIWYVLFLRNISDFQMSNQVIWKSSSLMQYFMRCPRCLVLACSFIYSLTSNSGMYWNIVVQYILRKILNNMENYYLSVDLQKLAILILLLF